MTFSNHHILLLSPVWASYMQLASAIEVENETW